MSGIGSHGTEFQVDESAVYVPVAMVENITTPDSEVVTQRAKDIGQSKSLVCPVGTVEGGQSTFNVFVDWVSGNHDVLTNLVHNRDFSALSAADRVKNWRLNFTQYSPAKTWDFIGVLTKFTSTLAVDNLAKAAGTIEVEETTAFPT